MSDAPVLTEEQWMHIKANDDIKTNAFLTTQNYQQDLFVAHINFLEMQVAPFSRRDAIAVSAMQGLITGSNRFNLGNDDGGLEKRIAEHAYMLADAMIKIMEPKP